MTGIDCEMVSEFRQVKITRIRHELHRRSFWIPETPVEYSTHWSNTARKMIHLRPEWLAVGEFVIEATLFGVVQRGLSNADE